MVRATIIAETFKIVGDIADRVDRWVDLNGKGYWFLAEDFREGAGADRGACGHGRKVVGVTGGFGPSGCAACGVIGGIVIAVYRVADLDVLDDIDSFVAGGSEAQGSPGEVAGHGNRVALPVLVKLDSRSI